MLARTIHYTAAARFLRYGRRKPNKCVSTRRLRLVVRCSGGCRPCAGKEQEGAAGRAAVGVSIPLQYHGGAGLASDKAGTARKRRGA